MKKFVTVVVALLFVFALAAIVVAAQDGKITFKSLDTNKDGTISKEEAAANPSFDFAAADKNGDGKVTKKEFNDYMKSMRGTKSKKGGAMDKSGTMDKSTAPEKKGM